MPELFVNPKTCTRCGMCRTVCPVGVIRLSGSNPPRYAGDGVKRCLVCGHCQAVCPTGAITVEDPRLDPATYEPVVAEIKPELLGMYLRMRRSVRSYREVAVDRDTIERVMDIVRYAPSSSNSQAVCWLIVHDTREVRHLTGMAVDWMRAMVASGEPLNAYFNLKGIIRAWDQGDDLVCRMAPHLVVAYAHRDTIAARTDAIIALSHLEIAAPAFGLGTCWAGFFQLAASQWEPLLAALDLPMDHVPIYAMMLGYPQLHYLRPPQRNPVKITWR
jgi:nitroreductase/NAD-dependent dihydropyrimidine dehydrogenase PreA subunit